MMQSGPRRWTTVIREDALLQLPSQRQSPKAPRKGLTRLLCTCTYTRVHLHMCMFNALHNSNLIYNVLSDIYLLHILYFI